MIRVVSRKSHENYPMTVGEGTVFHMFYGGKKIHEYKFDTFGYIVETLVLEIVDEPGIAKRAIAGAFVFEKAEY